MMWYLPLDLDFAFPVNVIHLRVHLERNFEKGVQVTIECLLDFLELIHELTARCTLRLGDFGECGAETLFHPSDECEVNHASADGETSILEDVRELQCLEVENAKRADIGSAALQSSAKYRGTKNLSFSTYSQIGDQSHSTSNCCDAMTDQLDPIVSDAALLLS